MDDDPDYWHGWLLVVCKVLSYSVLCLTCFFKAPQVYAVLTAGSAEGISVPSLLMEFTSYSIEMAYQHGMGYPLETYFEIIFMWVQDVILVYVVMKNEQLLGWYLTPYLILYSAFFTIVAQHWLPDYLMFSLVCTTVPILSTSKMTQLHKVLVTKDPGCLSALTWSSLTYMAGVRVLTTSVITKDFFMFMNVASSTVLNGLITISILYYRKSTETVRRRRSR